MYFANEVRDFGQIPEAQGATVPKREIDLAVILVTFWKGAAAIVSPMSVTFGNTGAPTGIEPKTAKNADYGEEFDLIDISKLKKVRGAAFEDRAPWLRATVP